MPKTQPKIKTTPAKARRHRPDEAALGISEEAERLHQHDPSQALEPIAQHRPTIKEDNFYLGDRLDVMRAIEPGAIDFILTSPPYNVGKPYANHHDLMSYENYLRFLNDTWQAARRILKTGGRIAINIPSITHGGDYQPLYCDVINQMRKLGFIMRCDILWHKHHISKRTAWGSFQSPSNPHVVQPYEFVLVFSKDEKLHSGNKKDIDISKEEFIKYSNAFWDIKAETRLAKNHPAPFPEELVYRLIKFYTYKNDLVLDMFGGSGTVAAVAAKTNRRFVYIDNSTDYLALAKARVNKSLTKLN